MDRYATLRKPGLETPACPLCGRSLDSDEPTCRECAYGGLDPEVFVRFFWEEA
jgi:hypothetical protein